MEAGPKKLQSIKSWDTFAFLGCFPIHTGPTPPSPTNNVGRAYPECFFFRVSTLYRVGEGELQENFEKDALFYEGIQK